MTIRQVLMEFQDKNDLKPDFEQEWKKITNTDCGNLKFDK